MKFSSKVEKCGLSPMRKFHPYAVAAEAKGKKIYHLNIGQLTWKLQSSSSTPSGSSTSPFWNMPPRPACPF